MAPINPLPPEVLIGVFGRTINTAYDLWDARPAVSITLNLCAVCSHWRRIMIGQATFWAYIPVGTKTNAGDLTGLFLERSQNSSLIDVVAFARHATVGEKTWQAINKLKQNVHRIRSLSIAVTSFLQLEYLLGIILRDGAPRALIHLFLMSNPGGYLLPKLSFVSEPCKQNFVQLCNQLQTLEMSYFWVDFDSYKFARLEKLILNTGRGFMSIMNYPLPTAPSLHFLEVRDIPWRVRERIDPEPACGVKVLRLRHPNSFCRGELEGHIVSKDWDAIDFHLPYNPIAESQARARRNLEFLIPYMRTNSSKITSLTLRNNNHEVIEQISTILQVLPNLHTLTFDDLKLTESILSLFIPPPDSSEPFPKFCTLRIMVAYIQPVEVFKNLISSHPIRRLDLWYSMLDWGDGVGGSYYPTKPSPIYEWLCERVPELYISGR